MCGTGHTVHKETTVDKSWMDAELKFRRIFQKSTTRDDRRVNAYRFAEIWEHWSYLCATRDRLYGKYIHMGTTADKARGRMQSSNVGTNKSHWQ